MVELQNGQAETTSILKAILAKLSLPEDASSKDDGSVKGEPSGSD